MLSLKKHNFCLFFLKRGIEVVRQCQSNDKTNSIEHHFTVVHVQIAIFFFFLSINWAPFYYSICTSPTSDFFFFLVQQCISNLFYNSKWEKVKCQITYDVLTFLCFDYAHDHLTICPNLDLSHHVHEHNHDLDLDDLSVVFH